MTIIALDAMGGDNAPKATVQGALLAAADPGLEVLLIGRVDELRPLAPTLPSNVRFVDAPDAVAMDESAVASLRRKPRSSIIVGLQAVKRGEAQAFLSFGNTGAVTAASLRTLGRIPGVDRPALGVLFINARGSRTLLLDVGANVDCRPAFLSQFATMGKAYFERVLHHGNPSVGLLNVGQEQSKGNHLTLQAYELLSQREPNFIGNVEGKELVEGVADIVVSDGFAGNVAIKVSEAITNLITGELRQAVRSKRRYMLAAWLLRDVFRQIKGRLNYQRIGGAPLFGVDGVVIIGHGRADAEAVVSGLRLARSVSESGFVDAIAEVLRDAPPDRRPQPAAGSGRSPDPAQAWGSPDAPVRRSS